MLQRALLRAAVPIAFSGGFNPRPRLSLPLPRSVGTQSVTERFCAVLAADTPPVTAELMQQLSAQLPADCVLLHVECLDGKHTFYPKGVKCVFTLTQTPDERRCRILSDCRAAVDAGERIEVQRYQAKKKSRQPFDISPFVENLSFSGKNIEVSCRVGQAGSVRIDELMQWLRIDVHELNEPVKRTAIQWKNNNQEQNNV